MILLWLLVTEPVCYLSLRASAECKRYDLFRLVALAHCAVVASVLLAATQ